MPGRSAPRERRSRSGAQVPSGPRGPRGARGPRGPRGSVLETSAGGLVVEPFDGVWKAALIAKRDRRDRMIWSLPKGHLEGKETPEEAAIREVNEETGIIATIVAPLGVIDFWFMADGKRIHKTVHHFLLRAQGGELSDADAEVAEVAWVELSLLPERLSYADERKLLVHLPPLLEGLT
jgi:ADP-ribose pyrophosphatase YjhB (NUDIX family)